MNEPVYIVDIFRDIVTKVSEAVDKNTGLTLTQKLQTVHSQITGVHYLVGHYTEIRNRLTGLKGSSTNNKYPLVALFQDFVESRGNSGGYYAEATLQLMIVYHSNSDSYTEDRYNRVFKPILYPIYEELLRQIHKNGYTVIMSVDKMQHDKIDRPNWGSVAKYGNDGNIFPDPLDGIELRNLKITFNQKCLN